MTTTTIPGTLNEMHTGLRPVDLIRIHRRDTGCAGSVIDLDGRCHTCGKGIR